MKALVSRFQPGEGPSRGHLHDYDPSCGPSFQALLPVRHQAAGCLGWRYDAVLPLSVAGCCWPLAAAAAVAATEAMPG